MDFNKIINKLTFVKKFSSKKPKIEIINRAILESNHFPSPGNIQPLSFTIVDDEEKIASVAEACQQSFIASAPYVIIITSNSTQLDRLYNDRSQKYLKHFVGSSSAILYSSLIDQGLSASFVAPFSDITLQNNIGIPEGQEIELIIAIGYKQTGTSAKKMIKPSLMSKIFFNTFGNVSPQSSVKVTRKDI